jgi:hypothetical protein
MARRKAKMSRSSEPSATTPRLGVVMRFAPKAPAAAGIRQMEAAGFRVAAASDVRSTPAVPNDFGGADVQYFERFGIAIVRREQERLKPMLEKAMAQNAVSAARPERLYRSGLGAPGPRAAARAAAERPRARRRQRVAAGVSRVR